MKDNRVGKSLFFVYFGGFEVNAYIAMTYFGKLKMKQLEFWKQLLFELIYNTLESGT